MRTIFLLFTSAVALLSGPAFAADIYRPEAGGYKDAPVYVPVNTWTGFYFGGNGGYAWDAGRRNIDYADFGTIGGAAFSAPDRSRRAEPEGGFGGGQFGYNWQRDRLVLGIETDLQGGDISDSRSGLTALGGLFRARSSTDWFGTVRGRVGLAYDRALIYFTGGFAYGDVRDRIDFESIGGPTARLRRDETDTGFVLGGGLEYKFTPSWSIKSEYQYIDLGSTRLSSTFNPTGAAGDTETVRTNSIDHNFHTVRVGINYHLGQDYEPLK